LTTLTAPQLVYQAALATGWPASAVADVPDGTCWLCQGETGGRGRLVGGMLSDTFNDSNLARGGGQSLCPACVFCLQERVRAKAGESAKLSPDERAAHRRAMKDPAQAANGVLGLRMFSYLATSNRLLLPDRSEWRDILLSPPEPPWTAAIALSGQKHLALRGRVNWSNLAPIVLLEIQLIQFTPANLAADLAIIEDGMTVFSKTELETGDYSIHRIGQFGLDRFEELEGRLAAMRLRRSQFTLAVYVAREPHDSRCTRPVQPRPNTGVSVPACFRQKTPTAKAQQEVWFADPANRAKWSMRPGAWECHPECRVLLARSGGQKEPRPAASNSMIAREGWADGLFGEAKVR